MYALRAKKKLKDNPRTDWTNSWCSWVLREPLKKNVPIFMNLQSKFTDLWIKNTNVKIFPSRNVKDLRGYTDVSYLFIIE